MKQKKLPLRMCAGCGAHRLKKELVRVVKSPLGEISLDVSGKMPGRGAYICPDIECMKKARKARRLEKAFSCQIPEAVYDALERELAENGG